MCLPKSFLPLQWKYDNSSYTHSCNWLSGYLSKFLASLLVQTRSKIRLDLPARENQLPPKGTCLKSSWDKAELQLKILALTLLDTTSVWSLSLLCQEVSAPRALTGDLPRAKMTWDLLATTYEVCCSSNKLLYSQVAILKDWIRLSYDPLSLDYWYQRIRLVMLQACWNVTISFQNLFFLYVFCLFSLVQIRQPSIDIPPGLPSVSCNFLTFFCCIRQEICRRIILKFFFRDSLKEGKAFQIFFHPFCQLLYICDCVQNASRPKTICVFC